MSYIPTYDSFDWGNSGADTYGSVLLGYMGWEPKATVDAGRLVQSDSVGNGVGWAVGKEDIATNGDIPVAFMRRQSFPEDVSVSARFKFVAVQGVAKINQGHELGVFARATGGTLIDGSGTLGLYPAYRDGFAYAATFVNAGANVYDLNIVRWDGAGVETVLKTEQYTIQLPTLVNKAMHLRLDVETNVSGDPVLTVYLKNFRATYFTTSAPRQGVVVSPGMTQGLIDVSGSWKQVLTVTDSSVSKIVSAGRCGFMLERERYFAILAAKDTRIITTVRQFDVNEIGGAVLFSDDMVRSATNLGVEYTGIFEAPTLLTATSLASDYTNDYFSREQSASGLLERDSTLERLEHNSVGVSGEALLFASGAKSYAQITMLSSGVQDNIPPRSLTKLTWAFWANFVTNDIGNYVYSDYSNNGSSSSGMRIRFKPGVTPNTYQFEALLGNSSNLGTTWVSGEFPESDILGQVVHYAITLSVPDARIRLYLDGVLKWSATSITDDPTTPTVLLFGGLNLNLPGFHASCIADEFRLYWEELSASQVALIADPSGVGVSVDEDLLFHRWGVDDDEFGGSTSSPGQNGDYFPNTFGFTPSPQLFSKKGFVANPSSTAGLVNLPGVRSLFAATRPADSTEAQNRFADFEFSDVNQVAGIFVRAGFTDETDFSGYRLDVSPDPLAYVRLVRVNGGVDSLIASASTTITLGTAYTIQLQVDKPTQASSSSSVNLAAFIDGTQIVLIPEPGAAVLSDTLGTIRDVSFQKIIAGNLEGMHSFTPAGLNPVYIDNFDQGPLNGVTLVQDKPTLSLPSEVTGVTGDLSALLDTDPLLPGQRSNGAYMKLVEYESGHQARTVISIEPRKKFSLSWQLDTATLALFRTFWDGHRGQEVPFYFTPEGEDEGIFSFADDRFKARPLTPDLWILSTSVIERISPSSDIDPTIPPSGVNDLLFWGSAQSNVYVGETTTTPPESNVSKTKAVAPDKAHRVYSATAGLVNGPSTAITGPHLNSYRSSAVNEDWDVVAFGSTSVINGKLTLEPRQSDEYLLAAGDATELGVPLWNDPSGFTFMAHIIPPTSGYGASEHILQVEDAGGNEMIRIGWTTSQVYRTAGNAFGNAALTGYDLGQTTDAKTIVVRWIRDTSDDDIVEIFDGGGTAVATTPGFAGPMTSAIPAQTRFFVTSGTESTSRQADAGIGTKVFVQDIAIWTRSLTNTEVNAIGDHWAAQYGSTWTAIV